ncbi:unnamed protein product [Nezara viridula]|uniref:Calponin-homology (CH) domain-containing protein n=1 Tax=Nezara viridula TaxID=85310 RepID=A0A9P0MSX6_NEZVI|nr:unnamed protein product [Nezara viridula]
MAGIKRRTDFFEVNVTPTSKKKRDSDPPPFLVLAPFALVPKISFNNVKLHSTVKTIVYFRNPVDTNIQIALEVHEDLLNIGLQLSAYSFNIPGNSTDSLELIWTPSSVVQLRGKICLKHLNGDKKFSYISVACSSVAPQSKKVPSKRLTNKKNNIISKKSNNGDITKLKSVRFADKFPECLSTNSLRRETYEVKEPKLCFPSAIADAKPRHTDYLINASFSSLKEDELEHHFQNSKTVQTSSPKSKVQEKRTNREPLKEFNLNIHLGEFQREEFKMDRIDGDISIDLSHLSFDRDSLDSPIQLSGNSALFEISPFKVRSFDSKIKLENRFDETFEDRKPIINLSINSEPIMRTNKHEGTFSIISLCSDSSFERSHSSTLQPAEDASKPTQPSLCFEISPLKPILKKSISSICAQKEVNTGALNVNKKVEKQKSPKRTDNKGVLYEGPHKAFYDEPDYLLHPYGMTAIKDPFSKHSIHCRDWLEKVELELIKWLNSLLRPPKELGSIVEGVDVMKLWDQSTASSLKLAPSRETACKEYVLSDGSHMIALRKAASAFAQSEHMKKTIYNIRAKIQSGFLSVKDNISLHHNQGARVRLVQMIMYYNPLWLRIALEVIYEEVIPLYENNIHRGLVYFLKQNLLSSQYIIEKNKFPKSTHLKPEFATEMNNFVVLKFLTLVYFLDHAKRKRLVPYDPCLFCKNSPIKDSEGMLNEFIKDFLKCVGHFKKTLKAIGYQLEYRQTYLDEFDYGLSTHLDLRDGVRLTRTMEIILKDPSYSQKLWTPAVSRIQKIHNVQVALSALANNGYTINEDIIATDIVNGHREKIYSLIWQILHKFLAPRYQSAAVKIQIWWRRYYAKIRVKKEAAIKIQRWYRKQVKRIELKKKEKAANIIYKWYRNHLQRRYYERNFKVMKNAVSIIEKWYKNIKLCEKDRKTFVLFRASVVKIQRWYRAVVLGRDERKKFILFRYSVIKIQLAYRSYREMKLCRDYFLKKKSAALKIQTWYRSVLLGRNLQTAYLVQKKAAITIQTWWRKLKDRREFLKKIKAAVIIQKWYRSTHKKKLDEEALRINKAAALIQAWWHGYITRKRMKKFLEEKLKKTIQKNKKQKKGIPLKQLFTNAVGFVCHSGRDLGNLVVAYNDIDVCTVFSPILCLELVKDEYFFEFMWNDLNQGFRDGLYLDIFVHCLNIILKLARYPETIDYLLQVLFVNYSSLFFMSFLILINMNMSLLRFTFEFGSYFRLKANKLENRNCF